MKLSVTPQDYMKRLVEYGIMKASVICAVDETTQSWIAEDDFQIIKPCLKLEVRVSCFTLFRLALVAPISIPSYAGETTNDCIFSFVGKSGVESKPASDSENEF